MEIAVSQRSNFIHVVATAGMLDSSVVLSAIDYLKTTLRHCPCRAALLEFTAPRQQLRLWELPGRWHGVFAAFPRFVRIAYVIAGKAFVGNADFSCYFDHDGDVSGKLFHNRVDAMEWLAHYNVLRLPHLVRPQRVLTFDNTTLRMHRSESPIVNQSQSRSSTRNENPETQGVPDF